MTNKNIKYTNNLDHTYVNVRSTTVITVTTDYNI